MNKMDKVDRKDQYRKLERIRDECLQKLTKGDTLDLHCDDGKWRKCQIVKLTLDLHCNGKIRLKYKRNDNDLGYIGWENMLKLSLCVLLSFLSILFTDLIYPK